MVLEQIAISDMVIEPTAQELDYEEYKMLMKCDKNIHRNFVFVFVQNTKMKK